MEEGHVKRMRTCPLVCMRVDEAKEDSIDREIEREAK